MNRIEFMSILEARLLDISESERKEAIQYYEDYLNDAGIENEQEVMEELGSPEELAENIKAGLNGGAGEFTENGYRNPAQAAGSASNHVSVRETEANGAYGGAAANGPQPVKTSSSAGKVLLIVAICILLSPIILPLGLALVGTVFGLVCSAAAVLIALLVAGIAFVFCGLAVFVFGIVRLFTFPAVGVILVGLGLLFLGFGLLLSVLMGWLFAKLIPPFIRWLVALCRKPFEKK